MKSYTSKFAAVFCQSRFVLAVALGLGIGWAMSASLGVAAAYAIGGSVTVAMLVRRKNC